MGRSDSLKTKIENLLSQNFNITYQLIAKYLIENSDRLKSIKIKDITENAFCSSSTLIKMCREFGCQTFKEFIFELANEYSYYKSEKETYIENRNSNQIIKNYTKHIIDNIGEAYAENEHIFEFTRNFIKGRKNIFIFGTGVNLKACSYLSMILTSLGYRTYFAEDLDELDWYGKQYMDSDSVCFFLSYSFVSQTIIKHFNFATGQKAKIIIMSRNRNMASKCDIFFRLGENESLLERKHNSLVVMFYIINAIMFENNVVQ